MNFLQQILRVGLAVGLVTGLILFSVLLYVSDFGGTRARPAADPGAETEIAMAEPTPNTDSPTDMAKRSLYWVFGPPKNPDTTAP